MIALGDTGQRLKHPQDQEPEWVSFPIRLSPLTPNTLAPETLAPKTLDPDTLAPDTWETAP